MTAALHIWPGKKEGTGQTGPGPGRLGVHMGGPGGCGTGDGGPWPCHILSASPPSLCTTQSDEEKRSSMNPEAFH